MTRNLKYITVTAVGIALFVVLALCLQVPVFENYYLCLGYVAMAVYCYSFGPLSGTLVGSLGVVLYCVLTNGMRGMPGWALGNVVIGLGLGLMFRFTRRISNKWLRSVIWIAGILLFTALGILGVKSLVDSLIRSQPFIVRATMNLYAFAADAAVLILSLPVCAVLDKSAAKIMNA